MLSSQLGKELAKERDPFVAPKVWEEQLGTAWAKFSSLLAHIESLWD